MALASVPRIMDHAQIIALWENQTEASV